MGEHIYTSQVKILKDKGPHRRAFIAPFAEPVHYGVHGAIKHFYGVEPEEELPTTLDHIVPPEEGGAWFDPLNLRAACRGCNSKRRRGTKHGGPVVPTRPSRLW